MVKLLTMRGVVVSLLAASVLVCRAADDAGIVPADSVRVNADCTFRPAQLIVPVSLMAAGTVGAYSSGFKQLNRHVRSCMDDMRGSRYLHFDDYVQYLPVAAYVGLDFVGVRGRHTFRERLAAGATAYLIMTAVVNATKYSVRETRPDSPARNSFPSGHTATAFTGAELIRLEYGSAAAWAAYTVATGVAFLRLYNGRHWLNDVIAGAGVGILSARAGYWMLPVYRRWFGWNDSRPNAATPVVAPAYDPATSTLSLNMSYTF